MCHGSQQKAGIRCQQEWEYAEDKLHTVGQQWGQEAELDRGGGESDAEFLGKAREV